MIFSRKLIDVLSNCWIRLLSLCGNGSLVRILVFCAIFMSGYQSLFCVAPIEACVFGWSIRPSAWVGRVFVVLPLLPFAEVFVSSGLDLCF
jgi:hypothetical protein